MRKGSKEQEREKREGGEKVKMEMKRGGKGRERS
jgi:hypothetical protein